MLNRKPQLFPILAGYQIENKQFLIHWEKEKKHPSGILFVLNWGVQVKAESNDSPV